MQVRLARSDEYDAIGEITLEAYVGDGLLTPTDPYAPILLDAGARAREAQLWVAVDDGELLGTVTYCPPGSPYREQAGAGQGEFRTLAVAPSGRGRGAATALVAHCLALAKAAGHDAVLISTLPEMVSAHRIYRRLGFSRLPERDWHPLPGRTLWVFARDLVPGDLAGELHFEVSAEHTAQAVGSGSLPVLGTPVLLAWFEAATCAALAPVLAEADTSVGVAVEVAHLAATGIGGRVIVRAEAVESEGRRHTFAVSAHSEDGTEIGNGRVTRMIVDSGRFMSRVG